MAVEVHVTGRVQLGRLAEFVDTTERWQVPGRARIRVMPDLARASGGMNDVRLIFTYPDLNAYEQEEVRDTADPDYARVAGAMPFVEGTLTYQIYREMDRS